MSQRSQVFYKIGPSKIQGKGIISLRDFKIGEEIDLAITYKLGVPSITDYFGSMINHSWTPNCYLKYNNHYNGYYVHAKFPIYSGDEITLDYRHTPWFIAGPNKNWK